MSQILDELVHSKSPSPQVPAASATTSPSTAPAEATPTSPSPTGPGGPLPPPARSFEARRPTLAERLNLRVLLFLAIILMPIAGLGYVYLETATSDGIRAGADGYLRVDLQKMSSFSFDQRNGRLEDIPEQWRNLDGKKVELEGEMAPIKTAAGEVGEFDLVYSVTQCCMTGAPQVQHFVRSKVVDNGKVRYHVRPVRVRGTLSVNVTKAEGRVSGVYQLAVESVEPIG